jgi:hypothetical protein
LKTPRSKRAVQSTAYTISTLDPGAVVTASEAPDRDRIVLRVFMGTGNVASVGMNKEQWAALCDLRYSLEVEDLPEVVEREEIPTPGLEGVPPGERAISLEGAKVEVSSPGGAKCPDGLAPDGELCPRCGRRRGPSGVGGGMWVHYPTEDDEVPF